MTEPSTANTPLGRDLFLQVRAGSRREEGDVEASS
jgi:hypothetical protein